MGTSNRGCLLAESEGASLPGAGVVQVALFVEELGEGT
jgi:hypothetical protein